MSNDKDHGTGIEWTHVPGYKGETWNPIGAFHKDTGERGWMCSRVSPGCMNCYAETMNVQRPFGMGTGEEFSHQNLKHHEFKVVGIDKPVRWTKPRAVFVNSMTDLFHEAFEPWMIAQVWAAMALCPDHLFIVITKRAKLMHRYLTDQGQFPSLVEEQVRELATEMHRDGYLGPEQRERADDLLAREHFDPLVLPNVWLGVSAEDQRRANERVPWLRETPAAVRFVSYEPALELVEFDRLWAKMPTWGRSLTNALVGENALDWIVAGGESGTEARVVHPDCFRSVRDQCAEYDVAFFFKQHGRWIHESQVWEDPHGRAQAYGDFAYRYFGARKVADAFKFEERFESGELHQHDDASFSSPVGKKRAGRHLDGHLHNAFPQAPSKP